MQKIIARVRTLALLGLMAGLAACGGYTAVDLGGTVTGLTSDGLVLANGSSTVAVPANATSYKFTNQIGTHDEYNVTVQTQPARATCAVANGTGTATGIAVTWANVICAANTHTVGGTIAGLTGSGLVLTNGSDTVSPSAGTTTFTFTVRVPEGATYGVAVLSQPAGQTCTVVNGTAVMGTADVTGIQVTCL